MACKTPGHLPFPTWEAVVPITTLMATCGPGLNQTGLTPRQGRDQGPREDGATATV